ncbi:MAG: Sec-independent protein translocase protein TatB [Paracoccaceae bacterium]|jgi:sec-independent protein translocase protein TatB|nr:Sec-independent protein translocase protein TatB [Paracoccaceae bacterium]MDP7186566.1 Sec-independent protein translocase protein TatB [Paracoccaceae bacterium]
MFGMGWAELMIVGIVALIVVGPKELPVLFRKMGQFAGKAKGMAREFSKAMNDAADGAGVSDIQKTLNAATNPVNTALQGVKDATSSFAKLDLDPESETGKLAAERAEAARKINAATARKVAERKKRELEDALQKAEEAEAEILRSEQEAATESEGALLDDVPDAADIAKAGAQAEQAKDKA